MEREIASVRYKAVEFEMEKEVRLVIPAFCDKMRVGNSGNYLIQYREVPIPDEETTVYLGMGPNRDPELAEQSLRSVMIFGGLRNNKWKVWSDGNSDSSFRYL